MNLLRDILRELFGLFVDDGSLALAIVGIVVLALMLSGLDAPPLVTGGTLVIGCLGALAYSVLSMRRR